MGLTLHYQLVAPPGTDEKSAAALVAQMRATAVAMKRAGRVQAVGRVQSSSGELFCPSDWLLIEEKGEIPTTRGIEVPATGGKVFTVVLGEGCEAMLIGLCSYPTRVPDPATGKMRRLRSNRWRFSSSSNTQYASLQSYEHFEKCHIAAVDLLSALSHLPLKVRITDEGGYWPRRDAATLRQRLDRLNGIVAAMAGAAKDAAEQDGHAPVESPIFAHPQFERIEAEGVAREGQALRDALRVIRRQR